MVTPCPQSIFKFASSYSLSIAKQHLSSMHLTTKQQRTTLQSASASSCNIYNHLPASDHYRQTYQLACCTWCVLTALALYRTPSARAIHGQSVGRGVATGLGLHVYHGGRGVPGARVRRQPPALPLPGAARVLHRLHLPLHHHRRWPAVSRSSGPEPDVCRRWFGTGDSVV